MLAGVEMKFGSPPYVAMTVSVPAGSALVVQVIVTGTATAGGPLGGTTEIGLGHSGILPSPFALNVTVPVRGIGPLLGGMVAGGVMVTVKSTASS